MTREEAIKILSCRDNRGLPITWQDGFVDAVDTAIEALEEPEIIHCKYCEHYDGRPCGIVDWYNTDSDFCSRAGRRTDDD